MSDYILPEESDESDELSPEQITALCREVLDLREVNEAQAEMIGKQAETIVYFTELLVDLGFPAEELFAAAA